MKGQAKMDTIRVNANASASSASAKIRFSFLANTKMAYESLLHTPPTSFKINGSLPDGRQLTRSLDVMVAYDDGEVVVSEPRFHIHAVGTTISEAIAEFKRVLLEELDDLTADEEELGPRLQLQLQYLRELIRTA